MVPIILCVIVCFNKEEFYMDAYPVICSVVVTIFLLFEMSFHLIAEIDFRYNKINFSQGRTYSFKISKWVITAILCNSYYYGTIKEDVLSVKIIGCV